MYLENVSPSVVFKISTKSPLDKDIESGESAKNS